MAGTASAWSPPTPERTLHLHGPRAITGGPLPRRTPPPCPPPPLPPPPTRRRNVSAPKILCPLQTLANGQIDGIANPTAVGMRSQKLYFDLILGEDRFYTGHRGWLSGSGTSRAILGDAAERELAEPAEPVPAGGFIAGPDAPRRSEERRGGE